MSSRGKISSILGSNFSRPQECEDFQYLELSGLRALVCCLCCKKKAISLLQVEICLLIV